jgi:DNA-binding response OmpR family regulator
MSQRGRVLIVDDDDLMQRAMRRAAAEAGLECIAVLDGALAMSVALAELPDLVVLDIAMPTADGRDILQALKRDDRTAGIPVFIHTSRSGQDDRISAFDLGADDYFDKLYDLTLLFRRVADTIERAGSGTYLVRRIPKVADADG